MKISNTEENGVTIVGLAGDLDTNTSPEVEGALVDAITAGATQIVINLENLNYVSSAGLRILLATANKLRAGGGELRLCCLNEIVEEVFEISGFSTILKVFGSQDEAIADV